MDTKRCRASSWMSPPAQQYYHLCLPSSASCSCSMSPVGCASGFCIRNGVECHDTFASAQRAALECERSGFGFAVMLMTALGFCVFDVCHRARLGPAVPLKSFEHSHAQAHGA